MLRSSRTDTDLEPSGDIRHQPSTAVKGALVMVAVGALAVAGRVLLQRKATR